MRYASEQKSILDLFKMQVSQKYKNPFSWKDRSNSGLKSPDDFFLSAKQAV
jgi:hypothetical protein